MRKKILGAGIGLLILAGLWFLRPRSQPLFEQAYVAERRATAWNRLAQVREPVAALHYGDRVTVLERKRWTENEEALIRTSAGATGWMEAKLLMAPELWNRAAQNLERSYKMEVQARGKTKVLTNVRVEPGRAASRSFQFARDVAVEVFSRVAIDVPLKEEEAPAKESKEATAEAPQSPRHEDWLFVRARDEEAGDVAGWVLGRFIEPELPEPLRDYSAGIRFIGWFELDRVPAGRAELAMPAPLAAGTASPPAEREKPQYLAVGVIASGGEGQACDFTLLRFYTWNLIRRRYETAYVESNLCGRLPVHVTPIPAGANLDRTEAKFSFTAAGKSGEELREYRMKQNIMRRVRTKETKKK